MSRLLGAVLAGGRSQRFGRDKAFASLGGATLVHRAERSLRDSVERVVVIANEVEAHREAGHAVLPDRIQGIGPLGGLHTAVACAEEEGLDGVAVLATDMPFVPPSLFQALARRLATCDIAAPASPGPRGFEPLCAVYHVRCLTAIEAAVERGDRTVVSFYPEVEVRIEDLYAVELHGRAERMFFNINRPGDYAFAGELLAELETPGDARPGTGAGRRDR
ncbi:MAG: molybdenum cofactor guanylyltransferase [marine benthic group bacterium]|nr:molybdenum cofactor guanylyltransferase [Candidatus Benthicola marisminoris]